MDGMMYLFLNTLRPRQNGRHFTGDIFNENIWILINITLNCHPKGQINNVPALVQIMAWHCPGDKPESMMVSLLTHISVTLPHWVNHTSHLVGHSNQCEGYHTQLHIKGFVVTIVWSNFDRLHGLARFQLPFSNISPVEKTPYMHK